MSLILKQTRESIGAVAHLGDGWDEIHDIMRMHPGIPLYAAAGNCDYGAGADSLSFSILSKKIVMTHGHRYNVKSGYLRLSLWAEENGADVCLFGHTHIPDLFYYGRTLMLNPGSISLPWDDYRGSYGVVDISDSGLIEGRVMAKMYGEGKEFRRIL